MDPLSRIQKHNNLNDVYASDAAGPGGARHDYVIVAAGADVEPPENMLHDIAFQRGPRADPSSRHGVLDTDLLEIVRDRLTAFQRGAFATRENACALTHIEEALMWMAKRVDDRAERGVLGTMKT